MPRNHDSKKYLGSLKATFVRLMDNNSTDLKAHLANSFSQHKTNVVPWGFWNPYLGSMSFLFVEDSLCSNIDLKSSVLSDGSFARPPAWLLELQVLPLRSPMWIAVFRANPRGRRGFDIDSQLQSILKASSYEIPANLKSGRISDFVDLFFVHIFFSYVSPPPPPKPQKRKTSDSNSIPESPGCGSGGGL